MSAREILARLQALPAGENIDFEQVRTDVHAAYADATSAERELLLQIYGVVLDRLERAVSDPEDLAKLKVAREQDYNLLLITESLDGDNVSAAKLLAVTDREIAAGRMAPNDETRLLALQGVADLYDLPPPRRVQQPTPAKRGFLSRLFGR